ncbi:MAG: hypothetical protein P4L87_20590 [Formivibrio sp.]|nr:hypothetical protein [Formivibrio sp.]
MKNFLIENKIFFEIFTSILLGVMAIVVSVQANLIAKAQLALADESKNLTMLQHLPEIKAKFEYVDSEKRWRKERLVISNVGDEMHEFSSYEIAFVSLKELQLLHKNQEPDPSMHLKKARIPLAEYFPNVSFGVNQDKGVICTMDVDNTNLLDKNLGEFENLYLTNNKSMNSNIERFLRVGYKDKFRKKHVEYLKFGPAGESIPMNIEEGVEVFKEYEAKNMLNFTKSTAKDINILWLKYGA